MHFGSFTKILNSCVKKQCGSGRPTKKLCVVSTKSVYNCWDPSLGVAKRSSSWKRLGDLKMKTLRRTLKRRSHCKCAATLSQTKPHLRYKYIKCTCTNKHGVKRHF